MGQLGASNQSQLAAQDSCPSLQALEIDATHLRNPHSDLV